MFLLSLLKKRILCMRIFFNLFSLYKMPPYGRDFMVIIDLIGFNLNLKMKWIDCCYLLLLLSITSNQMEFIYHFTSHIIIIIVLFQLHIHVVICIPKWPHCLSSDNQIKNDNNNNVIRKWSIVQRLNNIEMTIELFFFFFLFLEKQHDNILHL